MDSIKNTQPPVSLLTRLLRSKALVVTLIVLPGLWPAWPLFRQDPSVLADPLKYILHHLGFIACVLLAVVLTFTPLRVLFPKSSLVQALNRHRRLVGVSAFFYALLHLATHLLYEGGFAILASDVKKPFLLTGLVAFRSCSCSRSRA
jgi:sulfoxide reductase heme-binding subunit YedZ